MKKIYVIMDTDDGRVEAIYDEFTIITEYEKYCDPFWGRKYWKNDISVYEWEMNTDIGDYILPEDIEKLITEK